MLYELITFQGLVLSGEWCYLNERRVSRTKDNYSLSDEDIAEILCSLTEADFDKQVLNCAINEHPGLRYVDADQYRIFWDLDAGVRRSKSSSATVELSLKIAIVLDSDGQVAGLVTLHPSGVQG
jgi:hypothetical protein